jgi:hypothetical protein
LRRLAIFAVADFVDDPAELGDDMEEVEDDLDMGDFLAGGFDIRVPHIHGNGFQRFALGGGQLVEETA